MLVWALTDGRAGNDNQTLAIAEKFDNYKIIDVKFSPLAKLPNFILRSSGIGIKLPKDHGEWPDIVISTGRKLARASLYIKNKSGCKSYQLMNPQLPFHKFDHIFLPEHDEITGDNITQTIGAPNRIDEGFLAKHTSKIKHPNRIAMLIGDVSRETIPANLPLKNLHITTSRRTKPDTVKFLKNLGAASLYIYPNGENPYYNLLATAEEIYVSADSVGMISESLTTGKPTHIFGKPPKEKFVRFINSLEGVKKLSTRDDVVEKIKNLEKAQKAS